MTGPIPELVACAHRKCQHLTSGGRCGLLLAGRPILLNARGQCEMFEELAPDANQDAEPGSPCGRRSCGRDAMSVCAICGVAICAHHRAWIPNGGIGPDGDLLHTAYCDICTLRYVRQVAGADLESGRSPVARDDYDDPDDPWQPA